MKNAIRPFLAASAMALVLAACGNTEVGGPTATPEPSNAGAPTAAPDEPADASPEPAGTLMVSDRAVADGPGTPLEEALAGDLSQPVLVRGALFLGIDGLVYLADAVNDASVPEFGDLRLRVENYPTDGPTWDMADADITGLQEANGIRFYEDTKLYGTIRP